MIETKDVGQILREVEDLKRRSRRHRDEEKYDRAAETLQRAVALIEPLIKTYDVASSDGGLASQDLRDLAAQLADCFGSLGGIRRRQGDLEAALELYAKGRQLEQTRDYAINNTYNQVQWLIVRILLDPRLIRERNPIFFGEINDTMSVFDEQIAKQPQDPWLRSDKGLLLTLLGDEGLARRSWAEMDKMNPIPSVYKSGLSVLETLAKSLPEHRGLQEAVAHFQDRIDSQ